MPPENDTQLEQTAEELEQANKEAEAEFGAGFKKVRGEKPADGSDTDDDKPEPDDKTEKDEKAGKDTQAAAPAAAAPAAPAADEWEGVSPAVRKRLEAMDAIASRVRNVEGHIGGLNSTLQQLSKAGKNAATDQGAASPSDEQVAAAINDDEAWAKIKDEYPEWANGFEKQMAVVEKRILGKVQKVDVDAIRNDIQKSSSESAQAFEKRIEDVIPLYVKHPNWKKDINSPEVREWMFQDGDKSLKDDYAQYKQIENSSPEKAGELLNDIIRRHPNWWAEKGSKIFSNSTDDAIALMDSYSNYKAAKAATTSAPAENSRREKTDKRLKAATVPKGSTQPPQPGAISDQDAFNRGFKKQRKA